MLVPKTSQPVLASCKQNYPWERPGAALTDDTTPPPRDISNPLTFGSLLLKRTVPYTATWMSNNLPLPLQCLWVRDAHPPTLDTWMSPVQSRESNFAIVTSRTGVLPIARVSILLCLYPCSLSTYFYVFLKLTAKQKSCPWVLREAKMSAFIPHTLCRLVYQPANASKVFTPVLWRANILLTTERMGQKLHSWLCLSPISPFWSAGIKKALFLWL